MTLCMAQVLAPQYFTVIHWPPGGTFSPGSAGSASGTAVIVAPVGTATTGAAATGAAGAATAIVSAATGTDTWNRAPR